MVSTSTTIIIVRRVPRGFGDGLDGSVPDSPSVGERPATQVEDRSKERFPLAQLALVLAAVGTDDFVPQITKGTVEDLLQQLRLLLVEVEMKAGADRG
jgi:hypothetical protein